MTDNEIIIMLREIEKIKPMRIMFSAWYDFSNNIDFHFNNEWILKYNWKNDIIIDKNHNITNIISLIKEKYIFEYYKLHGETKTKNKFNLTELDLTMILLRN